MKKILFLAIFLFLIPIYAIPQADHANDYDNTSVTFSLLSAFDIMNPAIQVGYEFELDENDLLRLESGIIIRHSVFGLMGLYLYERQKLYSYSGYKIRTEYQHILRVKGTKNTRKDFVACELYFTHNAAEVNIDYYDYRNEMYNDDFQFVRNKLGANFKVGKKIYSYHFLIEFSGGLGIAYLNNYSYNRESQNADSIDSLYDFILRDGKFLRVNTPFNIRLGYRF